MEVSKIHLSPTEMELMQNAEVILTKNRVLEKTKALLENVQEKQMAFIREKKLDRENEIFRISPKISRGENYLGLPYLILDYPRQSSRNQFFFIRTMFWWGHFFSCTLHLAKDSKALFKDKIRDAFPVLKDYFISINNDPWIHHLREPDYRKIDTMTRNEFEANCENLDYIKIAGRHPLTAWERLPSELLENWRLLLSVCGLIP